MKLEFHIGLDLQALHRLRANFFTLPDNALIARYCFNTFAPYYGSSKSRFYKRREVDFFDRQARADFSCVLLSAYFTG
jgi:hypothetical protein